MEYAAQIMKAWLPENVFLRFGAVLGVLTVLFVLLYWGARALQALTHRIWGRKEGVAGGWAELAERNRLTAGVFFAAGTAAIAAAGGTWVRAVFDGGGGWVVKLLNCMIVISAVRCACGVLNVFSDKYYRSVKFPIQGLVQALKVLLWMVAGILLLSVLIEKEPWYFIGSLTAVSAILLLVFKDAIIGLVSGFQLSLNDSVRVGDWIEVPGAQANGVVSHILLTTVRVRNWDNTLVNIPAYNLVSAPFKNWRGVQEAGSRRLRLVFYVDINSVRKLQDGSAPDEETNLGRFRLCCETYLRSLPGVQLRTPPAVQELEPGVQGQPLELRAYTDFTGGAAFALFQSRVVEHVLTRAADFGLRIFQVPAGTDGAAAKTK